MNPYFKTTKGYNAEVIVAKPLAYSTAANLNAFLTSAADGAIGVFNADTLAIVPGTAAVAAGTKVFIAQKRDTFIHKTAPFEVQSKMGTLTPYSAPAKNKWTIDATGTTVVKGDVFELAIIELTRLTQPYHVWNIDHTAKAGQDLAAVLNALAAKINNKSGVENYAFGQIAVATVTGSTLVLEAAETGRFFRVALRSKLSDATLTENTKPAMGSGTYDGIKQVESEGIIFDGVTSNYPSQNILPEEFGKPTLYATPGLTYDVVLLGFWASEQSPLPLDKHFHKKYIFLALPATGTTPKVSITTIFGFTTP